MYKEYSSFGASRTCFSHIAVTVFDDNCFSSLWLISPLHQSIHGPTKVLTVSKELHRIQKVLPFSLLRKGPVQTRDTGDSTLGA